MSGSRNSSGLPFFPGYTFRDVTKSAFHRPQTLELRDGYPLPRRPSAGIGRDPLLSDQLIQQEDTDLLFDAQTLTNISCDGDSYPPFIPAYVTLDKKVLHFYAYFREDVPSCPDEEYRIRPVIIYYYLEDDTMCIYEPVVENSGIPQGKRLKRQRMPKNQHGEYYRWKDLNLAIDLEMYGVKYHIIQCDGFTKQFLEREGIILNAPELMPLDPHRKHLQKLKPCPTSSVDVDEKYRFFNLDQKVLRFYALWEDADSLVGKTSPVTIRYFLVDNTVEVRLVDEPNSGREAYTGLMGRIRLPKTIKTGSESFPSCVLEVSPQEVEEYYCPKDFQVGQRVKLLGRTFLLCDCDGFTKDYYKMTYPDMELQPIQIPKKTKVTERPKVVAPYNGFGSLEDSLQNCLSLIPEPPKRNVMKMLDNSQKVLRYSAILDSQKPADIGRRFILSYFLSNDAVSIFEKPTNNSGIIGGRFLEKTRIPKPGSTADNPKYYSPADLAIGAKVDVFGHRFLLTDADQYVLSYLEANPNDIPEETLESLRQKLSLGTAKDQGAIQENACSPAGDEAQQTL
ncbi:EF-hand domain-containing protein 1 [Takifugu flavidus]|uniref:EF-hand domain-containing protein 1 n=1 Tax=Takifugu flavidus TaxID=433684 RepID=UPI002544D1B0|nr:EF-hand domain-containing protein 1 [Takifugu flavidus]